MDDPLTILEHARALRQRLTVALEEFGDLKPGVRLLHDEVARIEECLKTLLGKLPNSNSKSQAPTS